MANPQDPMSPNNPGRGITPPATTMKARPQGESRLQRLLLPLIALAIFIALFLRPIGSTIVAALPHSNATPSPAPYPTPTATSTSQSGKLEDLINRQAQDEASKHNDRRTMALTKLGLNNAPSPSPNPANETQAQHDARVMREVQGAYDTLNRDGGTHNTGAPAGGPNAFGFTYGFRQPNGNAQQTPPPATPGPAPTPPPAAQRPEFGIALNAITPPPAPTPRESTQPARENTQQTTRNPYQAPSIYIPGPSGINYVGAEPGQQSGTTPQTASQMRVASQAAFLSTGAGNLYSNAQQEAARSYNEIFPDRPIHWVNDTKIVSTLPGLFSGHIIEDIVSNLPIPCPQEICPHELLIPNGTKIRGTYNADVHPGDTRIQTHPTALIFPNGATLALSDAQGSDAEGANGLVADVDNHVGKVYTVTLIGAILSGIGDAIALKGQLNPLSLGSAAAGGFGQSIGDRSAQAVTQQIQQAPTLTVNPGTVQTFSFSQIQVLTPYRKSHRPTNE